eukprot:962417-Prorocentrum_lima.AAC.1
MASLTISRCWRHRGPLGKKTARRKRRSSGGQDQHPSGEGEVGESLEAIGSRDNQMEDDSQLPAPADVEDPA